MSLIISPYIQILTTVKASPVAPSNAANLSKLDTFSLLTILDHLSLNDLVNVAALSPQFMELIKTHYIIGKYRLHEHQIEILYIEALDIIDADVTFNHGKLIINGYNNSLLVLKSFGSTFRQMQIEFAPGSYRYAPEISQYLNSYCSMATPTIRLIRGAIDNYIQPANVSFNNVTSVSLREDESSESFIDEIRLDRTFPQMQKLTINYYRQLQNLAQNYPNLKEFNFLPTDQNENFTKLYAFFRLNQQIEIVHTKLYHDHDYLRNLNEALPNLVSLSMTSDYFHPYDVVDGVVVFANVKHLLLSLRSFRHDLVAGVRERLSLIRFKQLQSISITSMDSVPTDFLLEWMADNKQLSVVLMDRVEFTAEQLMRLVEMLPALNELSFAWSDQNSLVELWEILPNVGSGELKTVTVTLVARLKVQDVMGFVPAQWTLKRIDVHKRQLRFERTGTSSVERRRIDQM